MMEIVPVASTTLLVGVSAAILLVVALLAAGLGLDVRRLRRTVHRVQLELERRKDTGESGRESHGDRPKVAQGGLVPGSWDLGDVGETSRTLERWVGAGHQLIPVLDRLLAEHDRLLLEADRRGREVERLRADLDRLRTVHERLSQERAEILAVLAKINHVISPPQGP
jgi:hypothetical protein